jgi:hypothetical protein
LRVRLQKHYIYDVCTILFDKTAKNHKFVEYRPINFVVQCGFLDFKERKNAGDNRQAGVFERAGVVAGCGVTWDIYR